MATKKSNRCLYKADFKSFVEADRLHILGCIVDAYHGNVQTTSEEAWFGEINLLQDVLQPWKDEEAEIILNMIYRVSVNA